MITIPAECLSALGDLEESDPPVLVRTDAFFDGGEPSDYSWHPRCQGAGETLELFLDGCEEQNPRLLLPQSSPALLRVLYRGVEYSERVPAWARFASGCWRLGRGLNAARFVASEEDAGSVPRWSHVPTLAGVTDPTMALACVVVWLARLRRAAARDTAMGRYVDGFGSQGIDIAAALTAIEQNLGLPAWEVMP